MRSFFKAITENLKNWVAASKTGTYDHYTCYLPAQTGMVSFFALNRFFSGIRYDDEQVGVIENLPDDSIKVYVTRKKSPFEFLFYHNRFRQLKLPQPEIGLDLGRFSWQPISRLLRMFASRIIYLYANKQMPDRYESGYIKEKLLSGHAASLSLMGQKGFYGRFVKAKTDPIRFLIDLQAETDRPIVLIPQLMFFGKSPQRSIPSITDILFGPEIDPGVLRKLTILFHNPGKVFVETSAPLNLKTYLENCETHIGKEQMALNLRKQLQSQINKHRQSITGPVLKTPEELRESILTGKRLQDFMAMYARKRNIPILKVRKKADSYVKEIAAKYNAGMIKMLEVLVGWIVRTMFDGVSVNKKTLSKIKSISRKGPLILIPCHRSHIDYLILSYILYRADMPCPHIAAGKNLSFWPLGPIFRSGGAFFIRRSFRGALLYSKVFSEYIQNLLEEGFNIEFFIEGGRSRTGKMILPKLGLLATLLNAFRENVCDDMIFVPIYIGYDRVLEETAYLNELEGRKKEPENLKQVLKARKFLKKRYGRIYIKFHDPISFNDLLSQMELRMDELSAKEQSALCRNLGHRVINAINSVTVVTPHAVVAATILNGMKKRFSREYMMENVETYMAYLNSQKATLADTLLIDQTAAIDQVLETYVQRKFIERIDLNTGDDDTEKVYAVIEGKRPNLEYYKNNGIAYFIPAAFTAIAILDLDAFQFSASDLFETYRFLQEYFKDEFAYDVDRTPEYFTRKNIKAFIDDAILMPHPTLPDTYNLTSAGYRKLKLYSLFLKTYFESYLVVLNYFKNAPAKSKGRKEQIKKIVAIGGRMYKLEEIECKEALSEINYRNAVKFFNSRGINSAEDVQGIDHYLEVTQRYLNLMST